jgi:hypothetical protein
MRGLFRVACSDMAGIVVYCHAWFPILSTGAVVAEIL